MPLTKEQRQESMAKAREARAARAAGIESRRMELKEAIAANAPTHLGDFVPVKDWDDLKAKMEILWSEREQRRREDKVEIIRYQCKECRATVDAPHPKHRQGVPTIIECPNRFSLHGGLTTEMDYTP